MQTELPEISERGKGHGGIRYALWEDINEAIKPVMSRHGFALSFRTGREDGQIIVTGVLTHSGGHSEQTTLHLPVDSSGSKNAVQAVGSSTSYGKRYVAQALLNLTSRGEDDDGHRAGIGQTITEEQAADLRALMQEVGADEGRFCKYMAVQSIDAMPASKLKNAIAALEAKRTK